MRSAIAATVLLLLTVSCFTVVHEYQGAREVTPGTVLTKSSTKLGNVSGQRRAKFLFWGLVDLNNASGPDHAEELAVSTFGQEFDGLTHIRIHEEQGPVDVLVEILTFGIFSMLSVETEAEVHRFAGGDA